MPFYWRIEMKVSSTFVVQENMIVTEVNGQRLDPPILVMKGKAMSVTWTQERGPMPNMLDILGYRVTPDYES